MSKKTAIKLLSTAAILLAAAAASQASLIGNNEVMKARATVTGELQRPIVGSDIGSRSLPDEKFDFDDLSVALRWESQDCKASDPCIGSIVMKLKDLDASQRQNAMPVLPMVVSVTTTLEKYVADFTWSASTAQKRTHVVIPLEVSQSDEPGRDGEVTFSSAATLALIGASMLGLGLAGRRSRHRARSK